MDAKEPMSNGRNTSEFFFTKRAGRWATAITILGALVAMGPEIIQLMSDFVPPESAALRIAGAIIAVAGIAYRALVEQGYIKSRTPELKKAEMERKLVK